MVKIEPAGHRVMVRIEKPEEKTKGGIIIVPDTLERMEKFGEIGEVVAIGKTAFHDYGGDWGVRVGMKVFFTRQGGKLVTRELISEDDNAEYRVINDEDIIGMVPHGG